MAITYEDRLRDSGHFDITPEQEHEIEAREECVRRGIDPDDVCADGGVLAWMVVDKECRETSPAQSNVLSRALAYLEGSDPNATSGGERNSELRNAIRAALATTSQA